MDVRRATIEDAEELGRGLKVVVDEERWVATENPISATELAARTRQRFEEGQIQFVLEDGSALVGILSLRSTRADGVLGLGMWILPGHRGRGGGSALMEAALAARPPDVHKIELEAWPDNEAALALYRRFGFEQEGCGATTTAAATALLRSAVIMARLFPPSSLARSQ